MNFAVCAPDPNAGIRMQARIEKKKKDTQWHSAKLKYWNKEVSVKARQGALTKGLSRSRSDAYSKALWTLGKGRLAQESVQKQKAKLSKYDQKAGVSRSNRYMSNAYKAILDKQRAIESTIDNTFGRNMDIAQQAIKRNHMYQVAQNRMRLGTKPEYGAPVMMPPKDRAGQMMANLQMGLSIASLGFSFSDIKLKENIEQVGTSPSGHKIYEWNYKVDKNTRYRGVIAQDVMKIDPMAVGIRDNYLTVNYHKLDVDMEIVS